MQLEEPLDTIRVIQNQRIFILKDFIKIRGEINTGGIWFS